MHSYITVFVSDIDDIMDASHARSIVDDMMEPYSLNIDQLQYDMLDFEDMTDELREEFDQQDEILFFEDYAFNKGYEKNLENPEEFGFYTNYQGFWDYYNEAEILPSKSGKYESIVQKKDLDFDQIEIDTYKNSCLYYELYQHVNDEDIRINEFWKIKQLAVAMGLYDKETKLFQKLDREEFLKMFSNCRSIITDDILTHDGFFTLNDHPHTYTNWVEVFNDHLENLRDEDYMMVLNYHC